MKTILLFAILLGCSSSFGQDSLRVLFLGNSYTNYNNLPQMVANLAASAGDNVVVASNTPGGYTLEGHTTNATSLQLIAQGNWDYVVLQQQSQMPSFPIGQVQTQTFPFAAKLDSLIKDANSCTETMLYMTWGRENGDASNCANWPPVCTYEGMDDLLRQRYDQMAVDNEGVVSPVGPLWRYVRTNAPGLQLYASDGSHPSLAGSYAAACSFYSTLFRKDPTLITDDAGVSAVDALTIRNSAKAVVFDSLETWHIGEYDPVADFDFVGSFFTASFTDNSYNATTYSWDFGDGQTSTTQNPVHVYANTGMYAVTLTVENCGVTDVFIDTLVSPFTNIGLSENQLIEDIQVSPNPTTDNVFIPLARINQLSLVNASGEEIEALWTPKGQGFEIDFSALSPGTYWLRIESEGKFYQTKVAKQ